MIGRLGRLWSLRALAVLLALVGLANIVAGAFAVEDWMLRNRALLLTVGFAQIALALALKPPRRLFAPAGLALFFAVYGGFSALIAVDEVVDAHNAQLDLVRPLVELGLFTNFGVNSFSHAVLVTVIGGVAALAGALVVARFAGESSSQPAPEPRRVERVAQVLVVLGFLGLVAALARFALTQLPSPDLWASMKSFWRGNAYLLLLANAAVPGLALWFHSLLLRRAPLRRLAAVGGVAVVYVAALAPTGQRLFALELALLALAILLAGGATWRRGLALALVVLVIPTLGVTQALRNEIRETGTVSTTGVTQRLEPENWSTLYGSQLASFRWTWEVAAYRERIDAPNTLLHAFLKPVPRQLLPDKVQGFGTEFTRALHPEVQADEVAVATPLVAEADYNLGIAGVIALLAVLGALAALAELFLVRAAPLVLRPIWGGVLVVACFVLLRGDLANGLVFAGGLIVPLAVASAAIGFRPRRRGNRIVIDALQVRAEFSGVGRQVLELGRELSAMPLSEHLELRCSVDTVPMFRPAFPAATDFRTPLRRSRPRLVRIAYQQLAAPLLDPGSILLVCPGDQAPAWGRASILLAVHDVRRLTSGDGPLLETAYYRAIVPRGVRRAAGVMTPSDFSRRELMRALGDELPQIRVVGHHRQPRTDRPAGTGDTLLVVGALRPYKGMETAFEALALLDPEDRPTLVLVGSTEGREAEIRRHARALGVADDIRLEGWVSEERLDELYRGALGTLNPSSYEGYGLPVAESLSYGLPTIASSIPPHREIAGGAALFFSPGDSEALAEQIRLLVSEPDLRLRLAKAALARSRDIAGGGPTWAELVVEAAESRS